MNNWKGELKKLQDKVDHLVKILKAQSSEVQDVAKKFRSYFDTEIRRANKLASKIQASIDSVKIEQKETAKNIGSVKEEFEDLRNKQETYARDLDSKIVIIEELRSKVERCFSKFDEQTAITKADVIAKLELHSSENYRRQNAKNIELEKSIIQVESELKKLAENHAKFVVDQAQSANARKNANLEVSSKVLGLENLLSNLSVIITVKNKELEESLIGVETARRYLAEEYATFVDDQNSRYSAQMNTNQDVSAKQLELENSLRELNEFVVSKMEQQLAIDGSAAADFHSFAVEKYQRLDTTCRDLQGLLTRISDNQKQLEEESTWLFRDQAELRNRLSRVEEEQTECTCSEMRRLLNRSADDRKELIEENFRLGKEQDVLQKRLARIEEILAEQGWAISEISESENENLSQK